MLRTRCAACKPSEADQLHLLTAEPSWGRATFAHREITLAAGASSTTLVRLDVSAMRRFHDHGGGPARRR